MGLETAGERGADGVDEERPLEALFRGALTREAGTLDALYDRVSSELFGFALWRTGNRADACDVVQETFCRILAHPQEPLSVRSPRNYLLTVAHRIATDLHRKRKREAPLEDDCLEDAGTSAEGAAEASRLSSLLRRLPPEQRESVYLRCYAGLSFAEIGAVTETSLFTAASRYRLGIARLRRMLGAKP